MPPTNLSFIMLLTILLLGVALVDGHNLAHNSWDSFHDFEGCDSGESRKGLGSLKRYLHHFGYMPGSDEFDDNFDDSLRSALLTYQNHFHLNVTGVLDAPTIDLMVQPRCGVADVVNGSGGPVVRGRNLYSYFPGVPTWPPFRRDLTYAFTSSSSVSIAQTVLRKVFNRAFARWAKVTTLTFTETTSVNLADITIGFHTGDHGDGEPFDGPLGTLAHAFSPPSGRFHLDADENWVATDTDTASSLLSRSSLTAIDLESVAVHEIGHLLGLGHSTVEEAIMFPTLRSGVRKVDLAEDDVAGIQSLYGRNPNNNGNGNGGGRSGGSGGDESPMAGRETNAVGVFKPEMAGSFVVCLVVLLLL